MRIMLKWMAIIPVFCAYILTSSVLAILPGRARRRRLLLIRNTSFFSRLMLGILGIRVHVRRRERIQGSGAARLIVSNHLSYTDVLVLASLVPAVFITSVELGRTPVLGLLARLGGSLFVERRKVSGLKREITAISRALGDGFSVVLFPEGTTSNGDRVHPFKNSLFDAAIRAGTSVLPVCLRYGKINGEAPNAETRDAVFYYGGTSFASHFPRLLALKTIDVEVLPQALVRVHSASTRKEIAARAHEAVSSAYQE